MTTAQKEKVLDNVMAWMEERFEHDMGSVSREAAQMASEQGLVSGPLWDEIGGKILRSIFRERITSKRRQGLSLKTKEPKEGSRTIEEMEQAECSFPYYVNGKWYQLFDLNKVEVEQVASHYNGLSQAHNFEFMFLSAVAEELGESQLVRDVFNIDGLKELRREVARCR